eukprot:Rhum_TRINITY_DN5923_c0_g2::Rhum_TRINITY_DN5923_c0_g2_i1::g.18746::m.18746
MRRAAYSFWTRSSVASLRRGVQASTGAAPAAAAIQGHDHVAVGVRDLSVSKEWYRNVAGMHPFMADDPLFCDDDLAMVKAGTAVIALLRLPQTQQPLRGSREQRGHCAFTVSHEEIRRLHACLPALLEANKVHADHATEIDVQDYGVQLSLFVTDPDGNEVEFTAWVDKNDPVRFS